MMSPLLASTIGDVGTGVAALATLGLFLAACYAGTIAARQLAGLKEQLTDGRRAEGRRRVFDHLAQLFDHDFVEMDSEAQRLFNARPKPADGAAWETLWNQKTPEQQTKILVVMNFYEVVAGEYNDPKGELLDRSTADKALSYIASEMWLRAEPVVHLLRIRFKERLAYAEWEKLHETFSARRAAARVPKTAAEEKASTQQSPAAKATVAEPTTGSFEARAAAATDVRTDANDDCPPNPCVGMPKSVLVVAALWTVAIVTAFFLYIEIAAVRHFFPTKVGSLPISAIWFGAVGGLLVSLEGIFNYNRRWRRSYDYWHYLRPVLGAIMGTAGCLIFIVLAAAASTKDAPTDATFYAVVALALGYREANFRALLARLVDTVIIPSETKKEEEGSSSSAMTS
jgi:hypothetical protein